ncbi:MAG: glutathione S-transferase N-terminal domain-containing protein, partial [Pseudomonadota bacterium]
MSEFPLKIIGAFGSPYTRKMVSVLRYRRIPHQWIIRGSREDKDIPEIPVQIIPVLIFPDKKGSYDQAMVDSTPVIRRLETMYPERLLVPADPALRFLDELIEDYGDEWLTKAMFHYRWVYQADIHHAATLLPRWRQPGASDEESKQLGDIFADRQIG